MSSASQRMGRRAIMPCRRLLNSDRVRANKKKNDALSAFAHRPGACVAASMRKNDGRVAHRGGGWSCSAVAINDTWSRAASSKSPPDDSAFDDGEKCVPTWKHVDYSGTHSSSAHLLSEQSRGQAVLTPLTEGRRVHRPRPGQLERLGTPQGEGIFSTTRLVRVD